MIAAQGTGKVILRLWKTSSISSRAHDLLNYTRLIPVQLTQMNAFEKDDPVTWEALK